MCKVSVIIPCFNSMPYIENTVTSILNSDFEDFEVIIVDDGSQDDTLEYLNSLSDSRISFFSNSNHGVSYSRNYAIKKSKGKYIIFVDSDDIISRNFISEAVELIEEYNSDFVIGGIVKQYNSYSRYFGNINQDHVLRYQSDDIHKIQVQLLSYKSSISDIKNYALTCLHGKLFRSDLLSDVDFNNKVSIGEDTLFIYSYLRKCDSIIFCRDIWYTYFIRSSSAVNRQTLTSLVNSKNFIIALQNQCVDSDYRYIPVRALFQLENAVYQSFFSSKISLPSKSFFTNLCSILGDPFWMSNINHIETDLLLNRRYRLLYFLLKNHFTIFLYLYFCFVAIRRNSNR